MTDAKQPDARDEVEALGREVYGDDLPVFLATPRASLGGETPAALIERGDVEPVRQVLITGLLGDFG
jgi:hypothetical protein